MSLAAGHRLGPYEIVSLLGAGAMGEVYRARDPRLNRDVAIKVVTHAPTREQRDGLLRKVRTAAALSHPHVCAIYDVGEVDNTPFFVMELLEGVTLADRAKQRPFDADELLTIARQVADALAAAHERGIVHRDIKPSNVMVSAGLTTKIVDFGVAHVVTASSDETIDATRATHDGIVVGTIQYMAPEVLRGQAADARSDIWAFGVMMYELAAGRAPFAAATPFASTAAILNNEPAALPATVPAALRSTIMRALQKDPAQRFQRAADIRAALAPAEAKAPVPPSNQWVTMTAVAVVVMTMGGLAVWRFVPRETPRLTSTGAPVSPVQEANEAFELAMNVQRVQNDVVRARQLLERAVSLDPHFAEALRFHALGSAFDLMNGLALERTALYQAEQELQSAKQEAPDLISLPSAFAAIYLMQGKLELVPIAELDRLRERHPEHRDTAFWRAMAFWLAGDTAQAKPIFTDILAREPLWAPPRIFLADTLRMDGDDAGAIKEAEKVLDQGPNNLLALRVAVKTRVNTGDVAGARTQLDARAAAAARNPLWKLTRAWMLAHAGEPAQAMAQLDEPTLKYASAAIPVTLDVAEIYASTGDTAKSIEWFERSVRNGDGRLAWFQRDPDLSAIRNDPGFQSILDSVTRRP
jgi:tRNA A-37 threonylcarbamoyl transferase component Bud32/tetratricopeptide (TPR) repeat protein